VVDHSAESGKKAIHRSLRPPGHFPLGTKQACSMKWKPNRFGSPDRIRICIRTVLCTSTPETGPPSSPPQQQFLQRNNPLSPSTPLQLMNSVTAVSARLTNTILETLPLTTYPGYAPFETNARFFLLRKPNGKVLLGLWRIKPSNPTPNPNPNCWFGRSEPDERSASPPFRWFRHTCKSSRLARTLGAHSCRHCR
jgi:hypothetical protein